MSEITDMQVKDLESVQEGAAEPQLPRQPDPPRVFKTGTILTLRKAGHLRSPTPGQEYFAPAVVLEQYLPNGEIDALVWDASAGAHFVNAYPIRDIDARTDAHGRREMFVKRDNIGEILFDPQEFRQISQDMETLTVTYSKLRSLVQQDRQEIKELDKRLGAVEAFVRQFDDRKPPQTDRPGSQQAAATRDAEAGRPKDGHTKQS